MAYLTINGIDVPVAEGAKVDPTEVGTRAPSVAGMPRGSIIARKRTWNVRTGTLSQAVAATLRASLLSAATATITGDWLGSVTAWAKLGQDQIGQTVQPSVIMNFTLSES